MDEPKLIDKARIEGFADEMMRPIYLYKGKVDCFHERNDLKFVKEQMEIFESKLVQYIEDGKIKYKFE